MGEDGNFIFRKFLKFFRDVQEEKSQTKLLFYHKTTDVSFLHILELN